MLCPASRFLFGFLWIFTLHRLASANLECEPGQMLTHKRDRCVPCPARQYRPTRGDFVECLNCKPCGKYSKEISPCTSTKNTVCQCLEGFIPQHESPNICKCNKGSGIKTSDDGQKICKPCSLGTFSSKSDASCQPWKKCDHNSALTPGTSTSDVVCLMSNASSKESRSTIPPPTASVLRPEMSSASSNVSPAWTQPGTTSTKTTPSQAPPVNKQQGLWLAPLGCIVLLLLIQFMIMRVRVSSCFHRNNKKMVRQDSACGKPVEESGEKLCSPA